MKCKMMYAASIALAAGTATSMAAPTSPGGVDEVEGNSFTQKWRQPRNADFQPAGIRVDLIQSSPSLMIEALEFPQGFATNDTLASDGLSAIGIAGTSDFRFNVKFDGVNRSQDATFAWTITYLDENGVAFDGFGWWNGNAADRPSGFTTDTGGGGFGGDWYNLSGQLIPLPHPAAMAAAGLAGIAVVRRRR